MIEKLTPEQLKAVFDLSDTSDVTDADRRVTANTFGGVSNSRTIRLLKHYHPEIFVDPRLEAAKKLAREILAEENERNGMFTIARHFREGSNDDTLMMKATLRALLMDPPTGEGDDA